MSGSPGDPDYRDPDYRDPDYRDPDYRDPDYGGATVLAISISYYAFMHSELLFSLRKQ